MRDDDIRTVVYEPEVYGAVEGSQRNDAEDEDGKEACVFAPGSSTGNAG